MIRPPTRLEQLAVLAVSMAATDRLCRWMQRRQAARDDDQALQADLHRLRGLNLTDLDRLGDVAHVSPQTAAEFRRAHGAHTPWAN